MARGRGRHRYYWRTSEEYRRFDGPKMLEKLGAMRKEICQERAPLNSPDKAALHKITVAFDDFAEVVTGDREHFWMKMHRTMSGPNG